MISLVIRLLGNPAPGVLCDAAKVELVDISREVLDVLRDPDAVLVTKVEGSRVMFPRHAIESVGFLDDDARASYEHAERRSRR